MGLWSRQEPNHGGSFTPRNREDTHVQQGMDSVGLNTIRVLLEFLVECLFDRVQWQHKWQYVSGAAFYVHWFERESNLDSSGDGLLNEIGPRVTIWGDSGILVYSELVLVLSCLECCEHLSLVDCAEIVVFSYICVFPAAWLYAKLTSSLVLSSKKQQLISTWGTNWLWWTSLGKQ